MSDRFTIITGGRQSGKTARIIELSAETQGYIVCRSHKTAVDIARRAKEAGLQIPFPLNHEQAIGSQVTHRRSLLVDDVDDFWRRVLWHNPVIAMSLTTPGRNDEKNHQPNGDDQ